MVLVQFRGRAPLHVSGQNRDVERDHGLARVQMRVRSPGRQAHELGVAHGPPLEPMSQNALLEWSERRPHTTPPYFWSDQHGIKIQVIGL